MPASKSALRRGRRQQREIQLIDTVLSALPTTLVAASHVEHSHRDLNRSLVREVVDEVVVVRHRVEPTDDNYVWVPNSSSTAVTCGVARQ
jgi:hypothetical protein